MTTTVPLRRIAGPALATLLLGLSGCRDREIASYRVPHEPEEPVATSAPAAASNMSGPVPTAAAEATWIVPAGWAPQADPGGMRKGSFAVQTDDGRKADIAITVFPGDVGGDLANVNRWLGQIQRPPISAADLPSVVTTLNLPAGPFLLVDLLGDAPADDKTPRMRMLGAWFKQPDRTWFFKMTGEADFVGSQRETFVEFLRSVAFVTAEPAPEATSAAPASGLVWTLPAAWTPKDPGQMRQASCTVGAAGDFSIISFPGEAGGLLANINRWRGQIQLAPLAETDLSAASVHLHVGSLHITLVDYAGPQQNLLGAVVPLATETYFFKLVGPEADVAAARADFRRLIETLQTR